MFLLAVTAAVTFAVHHVKVDIPYSGAIGAIAVDPADTRRVLVATPNGGVFVSTDGARTWAHLDELPSEIEAIAFLPAGRGIVATSRFEYDTRGAGVWTARSLHGRWTRRNPCARGGAWDLSLAPDTHAVYVATDCGIAIGSKLVAGQAYRSIAALGNAHAVAGGSAGIRYTRDGSTWLPERTGIGAIDDVRGLNRDPRGGDRVYAVTVSKTLYESIDGGQTWRAVVAPSGSWSCGGTAFVKAALERTNVVLYYGNRCDAFVARFGVESEAFSAPLNWTQLHVNHVDAHDLAVFPGTARPYLMSDDGGLETTHDGLTFAPVSGPARGLDALAVTEVHGQYVGSSATRPDLYFATQDNAVWSVRGARATGSVRWEGFYMSLARRVASLSLAKISFAICGGCSNEIAGGLLDRPVRWRDSALGQRAPVLLNGSTYVQQTGATAALGLALTRDDGATWNAIASWPQTAHDEPHLASASGETDALQALQTGTLGDGTQIVGLARVSAITSAAPHLVYASMRNFGSLGATPAGFVSYEVYAVDPNDPGRIVAPDVVAGDVRSSQDGGDRWTVIAGLREMVTHRGRYRMGLPAGDRIAPLVSAVSFCPDDSRKVLAGTRAGGAYFSYDGARTWNAVPGSEPIAYATSIFWLSGCSGAWVATYGRGIWEVDASVHRAGPAPPRTPIGAGLLQAPATSAATIAIESGVLEEGERALDPSDPLIVSVAHVPAMGRYAIALDGKPLVGIPRGNVTFRYSAPAPPWRTGRHTASIVAIDSGTTLWTTSFVVP